MRNPMTALALAGALLALPLAAAQADDKPSNGELAQIHEALLRAGFANWGEIEREDDNGDGGVWEVDNAVTARGEHYDLKLDANYNIVDRKRGD